MLAYLLDFQDRLRKATPLMCIVILAQLFLMLTSLPVLAGLNLLPVGVRVAVGVTLLPALLLGRDLGRALPKRLGARLLFPLFVTQLLIAQGGLLHLTQTMDAALHPVLALLSGVIIHLMMRYGPPRRKRPRQARTRTARRSRFARPVMSG